MMKTLCALCVLFGLNLHAADAVNYTRLRKRIVGREVINNGQQVVIKYQQGDRTWAVTNLIHKINAPRVIPVLQAQAHRGGEERREVGGREAVLGDEGYAR